MTTPALVIGSCVAAAFVAALLAFALFSRRADRNGAWQPVRKVPEEEPVMRRWTGSCWEYRPMSDDELTEYLSREAW